MLRKFAVVALLGALACHAQRGPTSLVTAWEQSGALAGARQALLVSAPELHRSDATVWALEKRGEAWVTVRGPMQAIVGRNGFALPGDKREGDGRTPSGAYPIEVAFGYAPTVQTGLAYRQARVGDIWIDDEASNRYNTWSTLPTTARSFERMRRDDDLYALGAVIEYNTRPVFPGRGSAIFLHVWRGPDAPTAGCVALAKPDVAAVLGWLDAAKRPVVVMGTETTLAR